MSRVNERQVGGDHYRSMTQHWDFVELNHLGYLEGCATKYVTRSRVKHKSPAQDLKKAIHYVEKIEELFLAGIKHPRAGSLVIGVGSFTLANGLTPEEAKIISCLTNWQDEVDLRFAAQAIQALIEEATE